MRTVTNFGAAFSTFMRVLVMSIACLMISLFIFSATSSPIVRLLVQIACLVLTMSLVYPTFHHMGEVDRNLVDVGQKKRNMLKGLYIGILANVPFIFSGILLVIAHFGFLPQKYYGIYKLINSIFYAFNSSILPSDETVLSISAGAISLTLLTFIFVPIVAMFGYMLGFNRFLFKEVVFYKNKEL